MLRVFGSDLGGLEKPAERNGPERKNPAWNAGGVLEIEV